MLARRTQMIRVGLVRRTLVLGALCAVACGGTAEVADGGDGNASTSPQSTGHTEVASCRQSASTNAAGITVVVYGDGSADRTVDPPKNLPSPTPKMFAAGSAEGLAFLKDLRDVGDVSVIVLGPCGKSVSFGTTTTVTANGKTSIDLQCATALTPAQAALIADCDALLGSAG